MGSSTILGDRVDEGTRGQGDELEIEGIEGIEGIDEIDEIDGIDGIDRRQGDKEKGGQGEGRC